MKKNQAPFGFFGVFFNCYTVYQGWPTLVLESCNPACLRCFPASALLIQMNGPPSACQPGLHRSVNDPFMWIRCAEAGKHLRHAGLWLSRPGVEDPWCRGWVGKGCKFFVGAWTDDNWCGPLSDTTHIYVNGVQIKMVIYLCTEMNRQQPT